MERSGLQRLIPIILIIIVIGIAAFALFSLGRSLFGGDTNGSSETTDVPANTGNQALISTTSDRSVRMSVRGPIVAGEEFHSYTVTVSPNTRNMTTYVGYLGQQVDNDELENNTQAYEQFVYALSRARLMDGEPLTGDANNTAGICATGYLYMFDTLQGDNVVQSLWTSTCKGSPGSLAANLPQVRNLFQQQIPRFDELSDKVNM